jgi:hypothetical protein
MFLARTLLGKSTLSKIKFIHKKFKFCANTPYPTLSLTKTTVRVTKDLKMRLHFKTCKIKNFASLSWIKTTSLTWSRPTISLYPPRIKLLMSHLNLKEHLMDFIQ